MRWVICAELSPLPNLKSVPQIGISAGPCAGSRTPFRNTSEK